MRVRDTAGGVLTAALLGLVALLGKSTAAYVLAGVAVLSGGLVIFDLVHRSRFGSSPPAPAQRRVSGSMPAERADELLRKQHTSVPLRTAVPFAAPADADLTVTLDDERFHPFQWTALLVEVRISIQNRTDKIKYVARGFRWDIERSGKPGEPPDTRHMTETAVFQEEHRLSEQRQRIPGRIEPNDTVSGWLVTAMPHQPAGGTCGYTLSFEDELGVKYTLVRPRRMTDDARGLGLSD